ncbi:RNA-directed RNA polymerase (Sad-1) [Aspergillus heteromorphus CBS 117.55]|uniref:RNA-dependent RNA polymerase n=1 Tax=Aspergillus heteromorphus CBS 117.55 TaxID=1448321 RepID=A0A317W739_9EURO|nr:RNA-directed RNA polymerase (Sad-1) [Aspergillus heteromorphus CBS 117.55]PWY82203.1 RNA-directed RNA polymerase (Sad-1) [Aspergillus heteromorphus CBS 117.55]
MKTRNSQQNPRGKGRRPPAAPQKPSPIIAPWKRWESVVIRLTNLPLEANAQTIWHALNEEGHIFSIDLFEDVHGQRISRGKVRFKPPPKTDFWRNGTYPVVLPNGRTVNLTIALEEPRFSEFKIPSPVRPNVLYPTELKIPLSSMDIGVMLDETTLLPMRTIEPGLFGTPFLLLDLRQRSLFVHFQLQLVGSRAKTASQNVKYDSYRLKVPLRQMRGVFETRSIITGVISQLTVLDTPPLYHRHIRNIDSTFLEDCTWRDSDCWYRQTYIIHNPMDLSTLPISLQRLKPIIDIGRWNAFRFNYPGNCDKKGDYSLLCNIFQDYNISIEQTDRFTQWDPSKEAMPPVWRWIDLSDTPGPQNSSSLHDLIHSEYIPLPFSVRYQLEVCISNGYLSEFTMAREFCSKLTELGETQARKLLEYVTIQKKIYYNPMKIFDLKFVKGVTDAKIPPYCCHMRSATITPSTIYYNMPSVDISNRIIRRYMEHADRFLRVRFTDEKLLGRIHATNDNSNDEIFTRIKRALANGIVVGDRRYEFLAFGNSQFREHGAYFFAPLPDLTAANIRAWMGHFHGIRNVAKYAARLGQCFSTTRAIVGSPVQTRMIEDVERNGYTFSDGVGKISRFLALMAMGELKIKTPTGDPPSAFQFRLGGCKGMLAISSDVDAREIHIRKSQNKFEAFHSGLEIIRWSQFSLATLNRQLILVLSTLGIPDKVFHMKLQAMLRTLNEAMESDSRAIEVLKKYVDPNQTTLTVSQMVSDGFRMAKEPFITSILALWRTWQLKYLKEKAKIVIEKGANLLGVMDETGILKGHFYDQIPRNGASLEEKLAALPEIFLQISRPENQENGGKYEVIEGLCIMTRNPSLHPGDIRVVRAVNIPELRNLHDVVVLPQTGDQDVASMCSGGDLDGDDYLIIWDEDLLHNHWFREPMKYASNKARDLDHDVTVDEITSFFVMYMKNDSLPTIAHAHVAWADFLEYGVNEEKCIRLAQLHSDAVDYNKTGSPATMTRSLHPRMWPHFMEKVRPNYRVYHSEKILGQLYDAVERVDFVPSLEMPFDERILNCQIEVSDDLYQFARSLKFEYDTATRRIMAQHEIKTEFEVWSTFVLSHSNMSKDYKFHEDIGLISNAHREGFKKQCIAKVGGHTFDVIAPLVAAMYRVTHEEMSAALKKYRVHNPPKGPSMDQLPLISFPWIFPHILGRIARGLYDHEPAAARSNCKEAGQVVNGVCTQNNKSNIPGGPDDPFGLFTDDEKQYSPPPTQDNNKSNIAKGHETLEELLDFGFTVSPKRTSSSATVPSITPGAAGLTLLDMVNSDTMCVKREDGETSSSDLASPLTPTIEIAEEDRCVEIVEEGGDLEPTALDKLNEMLGL